MFTLEQIKKAHDKVQTGADFPIYIQELIDLGVEGYDTLINDGHVAYYGIEESVSTDKKYDKIKLPQPQTKNAL
jgi:uncharacterized protein YbcV (DUF1398 family)